jgi:phosphonate transport system substrate-binding protein
VVGKWCLYDFRTRLERITLIQNNIKITQFLTNHISFLAMKKKSNLLIGCFFLAMVVVVSGCGRDSDAVVIDFSKTVAVEQPGVIMPKNPALKVAVAAMVSPKETFVYYRQLLDYLGEKLGREVQFIQRKTYGEINELLGVGQIDLAFICSGPYVTGKEIYGFELLATPEVQNSHFYKSYLIVNRSSHFKSIEDLKGSVFAFTDPDSNTGKLVPTYWLFEMGEQPETFFGKTIYTYSHDNSILAVAKGLVDGAAIDGLIWEYYQNKNPVFTSRTRIIKKSEPYGIPPIVASKYLTSELKEHIRRLLLSMHKDPDGKKILNELMIDRFTQGRDDWYDSIRQMDLKIAYLENKNRALTKP